MSSPIRGITLIRVYTPGISPFLSVKVVEVGGDKSSIWIKYFKLSFSDFVVGRYFMLHVC